MSDKFSKDLADFRTKQIADDLVVSTRKIADELATATKEIATQKDAVDANTLRNLADHYDQKILLERGYFDRKLMRIRLVLALNTAILALLIVVLVLHLSIPT